MGFRVTLFLPLPQILFLHLDQVHPRAGTVAVLSAGTADEAVADEHLTLTLTLVLVQARWRC